MIKLDHVYKEYTIGNELFVALKDITLSISQGEFAAILGPSGSGKSTLMHLIGLLDSPTRGTIEIEGKNISKLSDDTVSRLRSNFVGFVFQQFNLINKLTVVENILLPTIYSTQKNMGDPNERAMKLLERFDMTSKASSYPNKISGGQQQRVAIARALINNPRLILADEPTGNLDTKTGDTILQSLEELNDKDNITVILVTHDKTVARRAKRQILIRDGEVVRK